MTLTLNNPWSWPAESSVILTASGRAVGKSNLPYFGDFMLLKERAVLTLWVPGLPGDEDVHDWDGPKVLSDPPDGTWISRSASWTCLKCGLKTDDPSRDKVVPAFLQGRFSVIPAFKSDRRSCSRVIMLKVMDS